MPTKHAALTAIVDGAAIAKGALRTALVDRMLYRVATASDLRDLLVDQDGTSVRSVLLNGTIWERDDTDTTTADDGTACIVTTSGGVRFKTTAAIRVRAVEARLSTPPLSPTTGQAWLIGAAPTGAWAANQDYVAVWTALGWRFIAPDPGWTLYDKALDGQWTWTAAGAWRRGIAAGDLNPSAIPVPALVAPAGLIVESAATATPPGTVAGFWVVPSGATGAWAGQSPTIAYPDGAGGWAFLTPAEGWTVYDKGTARPLTFRSGAWGPTTVTAVILRDQQLYYTAGTLSVSTATLAGTTSGLPTTDTLSAITSTTGYRLRFFASFDMTVADPATSALGVGLFRDSESNALDFALVAPSNVVVARAFLAFEVAVADTASHNYRLRFGRLSSGSGINVTKRRLSFQEITG
ncbi:DUF2793 domain-containing protein [Prosthecomicrobium hirschii]|uniref:DUF2793 domain-containing protein n=1 Tax=Prosthecodimorpha hirschii TaxID=665126 RepID=UPI002220996E|nr:DUF2793 domain-containing protein [Prosthecomicrobium hirschii]MCW1839433.1 DUF2793 domain-containing protein [Prosthecomicrobium hirschii]